MAPEKDSGHFFWSATRSPDAEAKYDRQFVAVNEQHIIFGEASTSYFWTRAGTRWGVYPDCAEENIPQRIRERLGSNLKLLLCLRDPVDRALSAFIHYLRTGEINLRTPFMQAAAGNGIIDIGFYAAHLAAWLNEFGREQFLILNFRADVIGRPRTTLRKVFEFLDVDPGLTPDHAGNPINPGWQRAWRNEQLWITDAQGFESMIADVQTVLDLADIFRADVAELDRMLGYHFSKPWATVNFRQ